jgi:hypothetical protein
VKKIQTAVQKLKVGQTTDCLQIPTR